VWTLSDIELVVHIPGAEAGEVNSLRAAILPFKYIYLFAINRKDQTLMLIIAIFRHVRREGRSVSVARRIFASA
jgi:hypothetical protein